jgi:2-polyprenyl-3-methyl-5-hydroxy-6-metoxy-1,4-benzoquinol methylase
MESHVESMNETDARKYWDSRATEISREKYMSMVLLGQNEIAKYRDLKEKRIFTNFVPVTKDLVILDVGCGSGRWELYLARRCGSIVGFDLSPALIDVAQYLLAKEDINNVTLKCCSVNDYNCHDRKFDIVIISSVMLYVPDSDAVQLLRKVVGMMNENGALFSMEFTGIRETFVSSDGKNRFRNRSALVGLFEKSGFRLEKEAYAFPPLVLPSVLHRLLIPRRFSETYCSQILLRLGLWIQRVVIDPVLDRIPIIYKPILYFKRAYPVHHRVYLYKVKDSII